jgi:hypothetical protein
VKRRSGKRVSDALPESSARERSVTHRHRTDIQLHPLISDLAHPGNSSAPTTLFSIASPDTTQKPTPPLHQSPIILLYFALYPHQLSPKTSLQPIHPPATVMVQEPSMSTRKQRAASRANGQKSKGPITPEGKAKSRFNALKHGIHAQSQIMLRIRRRSRRTRCRIPRTPQPGQPRGALPRRHPRQQRMASPLPARGRSRSLAICSRRLS